MSDIIKAIHEDMEEYTSLCEKYSEIPQCTPDAYGNLLLDCYGKHARELQKNSEKNGKRTVKKRNQSNI